MIARALVTDPRALILDEPSARLDTAARHRFMEMVRRLAAGDTPIVLITHHVEEISPEIDRVLFLQRGRVLAGGTKASMLTPDRLGGLFGATVAVALRDGYYHASV